MKSKKFFLGAFPTTAAVLLLMSGGLRAEFKAVTLKNLPALCSTNYQLPPTFKKLMEESQTSAEELFYDLKLANLMEEKCPADFIKNMGADFPPKPPDLKILNFLLLVDDNPDTGFGGLVKKAGKLIGAYGMEEEKENLTHAANQRLRILLVTLYPLDDIKAEPVTENFEGIFQFNGYPYKWTMGTNGGIYSVSPVNN